MIIGSRVKEARDRAGMSQSELGRRAGVSQPTINDIESGEQKSSKKLLQLAAALQVEPSYLDPEYALAPNVIRPDFRFLGENEMPVYSAAQGGAAGEMVIQNSEPIEIVPRPWYLKNVREGYAVVIIGESMIPAFEPGDLAVVNPRSPVIRGKHAIFTTGDEGEFRATIKKYLRQNEKVWHVEQYNPAKELDLPKNIWVKALRVVGKYEGG